MKKREPDISQESPTRVVRHRALPKGIVTEPTTTEEATRACPSTVLQAMLASENQAAPEPQADEPPTTLYVRSDQDLHRLPTLVDQSAQRARRTETCTEPLSDPREQPTEIAPPDAVQEATVPRAPRVRGRTFWIVVAISILVMIIAAALCAHADTHTPTKVAPPAVKVSARAPLHENATHPTARHEAAGPDALGTASEADAVEALSAGHLRSARDSYASLARAHPDSLVFALVVNVLERRIAERCRDESANAEPSCL